MQSKLAIASLVCLCLNAVSLAFNAGSHCLLPQGRVGLSLGSTQRTSLKASSASMIAESAVHNRREFLQTASAALVITPTLANADSTGKFSSKRTAKNRYVPRIKKGMELMVSAENGGSIEDVLADLDDMVGAMKLYGDAQKRNEVPDKISLRLIDDAVAFEKAAKSRDVLAAKQKLDLYFEHLPKDGKEPFGTGMAPTEK